MKVKKFIIICCNNHNIRFPEPARKRRLETWCWVVAKERFFLDNTFIANESFFSYNTEDIKQEQKNTCAFRNILTK